MTNPSAAPIEGLDLDYFVQWRQWAWTPTVRCVLSPFDQFAGARVLELGPNKGRMSCLFALLGAQVTALELESQSTHDAEQEIARWGLDDRVELRTYSGAPEELPAGPFDIVFTKSVLVTIKQGRPALLEALAARLGDGGRLLAAENVRGGPFHRMVRQRLHPRWSNDYGVDDAFEAELRVVFAEVSVKRFRQTAAAIVARV